MSKPKIFITGSSGLVGRTLASRLLEAGYSVRGFGLGEQYYRNKEAIESLCNKGDFEFDVGSILDKLALTRSMHTCDAVVHLAAIKGADRTENDRLRCFDVNVTGTQNALESCISNNIKKFILASSSAVYGSPDRNPVQETDVTKPINMYGFTKLAAEELTKSYSQAFPEFSYTIARMFNVYGELGNSSFVIDRFVNQVLRGENPVVFGDGSQTRCFTHVNDITTGLVSILECHSSQNKIYNLGAPSEVVSIKELAQKIIDKLALRKGIKVEMKPLSGVLTGKEVNKIYANIDLARKELGYKPSIGIDEGLKRLTTF